MKLLIAADMEGISGVVNWNQVTPGHFEYERFQRLMTADVNAAIAGAFQAGAEEIIVADGHHNGQNLIFEQLDPRARLHAGNTAPLSMVRGAAEDVDAVFFIGYHARASSKIGVLNHTWDLHIANVWLNDLLVGECGLNAAVCGHFNSPLLLVSGDQVLAAEAQEIIPGVEAAIVKMATSASSAECLPPSLAQEKISQSAISAIKNFQKGQSPQPFKIAPPITVTVEFNGSAHADGTMVFPGAERVDGRKVQIHASDMLSAYNGFRAIARLGNR